MNGYLLDTHALIWAINEPSRLGDRAAEVLRDRGNLLVVSAASAWEMYTSIVLGSCPA
ncbi:PIN domain-containing protein [uncultured Actinomyces sp.]|uniref:PIN domain-containing protein n=1 Tax=uncultured Actinomyces sp. TaxID=249061 RepID=UPI0034241A6E